MRANGFVEIKKNSRVVNEKCLYNKQKVFGLTPALNNKQITVVLGWGTNAITNGINKFNKFQQKYSTKHLL